jgi:hypothetical protein
LFLPNFPFSYLALFFFRYSVSEALAFELRSNSLQCQIISAYNFFQFRCMKYIHTRQTEHSVREMRSSSTQATALRSNWGKCRAVKIM